MRIGLQLTELTDVMRDVEFKVFKAATEMKDGNVAALRIPGGGEMPRSEIDGYTDFVKIYGAKGLAYIKVNQAAQGRAGLQSPIIKNLHDAALTEIIERTGATDGDLDFLRRRPREDRLRRVGRVADQDWPQRFWPRARAVARRLAAAVGGRLPDVRATTRKRSDLSPRIIRSRARRMGMKIIWRPIPRRRSRRRMTSCSTAGKSAAGRSVSIARRCKARCSARLKISAEEAGAKFGFLLDALQYGAPPHGGVAFGLDRLVAMMAGAESIRDVIAFPKTQRAQDLLTQAPSAVDEKQLRELHIRVRGEAKAVEPRVA